MKTLPGAWQDIVNQNPPGDRSVYTGVLTTPIDVSFHRSPKIVIPLGMSFRIGRGFLLRYRKRAASN